MLTYSADGFDASFLVPCRALVMDLVSLSQRVQSTAQLLSFSPEIGQVCLRDTIFVNR